MCGQVIFVFSISKQDASLKMFDSSNKDYIPEYRSIKPEDRRGSPYLQQRFGKKRPGNHFPNTAQKQPEENHLSPTPQSVSAKLTASFYKTLLDVNNLFLNLYREGVLENDCG